MTGRTNYSEIRAMMDSDTRTPAELLASLSARMKALSGDTLDDDEAERAARKLIGFCETLMQIPAHRRAVSIENAPYVH